MRFSVLTIFKYGRTPEGINDSAGWGKHEWGYVRVYECVLCVVCCVLVCACVCCVRKCVLCVLYVRACVYVVCAMCACAYRVCSLTYQRRGCAHARVLCLSECVLLLLLLLRVCVSVI